MRPLSRASRTAVLVPLLLTQIACDQVTKDIARKELSGGGFSLLGGILKLAHVENSGAFLGLGGTLGAELRFWLLVVGVGVALIVGLAVLFGRKDLSTPGFVAGAMIVAGGFGNLLDRIFNHGRVTDFMLLGVGPVHTGVFNVADLQIVAGVVLFVLLSRGKPEAAAEPGPPASPGS